MLRFKDVFGRKYAISFDQDHKSKKIGVDRSCPRVHAGFGISCVTITLYIAHLKLLDGIGTGQMVLGMKESGEK